MECAFNILKDRELRIPVSSEMIKDFTEISSDFGATFDQLSDIINTDAEKLKKFLRFRFRKNDSFKHRINECCTIASILELIAEKCSLTDITLLENTICHFEIEKAKPIIQEYNKKYQSFLKNMSLRLCLNKYFSCPPTLQCKKIVFVVNRSVDEDTVEDIEDILRVAVEEFSTEVFVSVVKKGNSYTIICSFPLTLSASLISTALKNLKVLKEKGIIKLTIGYCTVYDYKEVNKKYFLFQCLLFMFHKAGCILWRRRQSKGIFRYKP